MARPAEKARAMLNKWVAMREAGNESEEMKERKLRRNKRPHLASECEHLADAERYRGQILREIESLISKIQNPGLGEHAIREMNDDINHKMREKYHWNRRIHELGGVDYNALEKRRQIEEGDTQIYSGYRYFGAAKDLPGVRELLAKEAARRLKVKREDLYKNITPDYYGWRDEEDGVLLELEAAATKRNDEVHGGRRAKRRDFDESEESESYLKVAPQEQISLILLEHKKRKLLDKYSL